MRYPPGILERDLEQPLAGAIAVPADVGLVVTEGNYLLLDTPEWRAARACVDEVWWLDVDDELRRARLVARHVRANGRTAAQLVHVPSSAFWALQPAMAAAA